MEVKITDTAKKTAGLLRATAEVLQDVRSVAVELNPEAADAPARELAPMIAEGISERIDAVQVVAEDAAATAEAAKTTADSNKALLDAITASAVWPKPNDTAPLRIVATQDRLQGVVSRGELVWASEDADVIRFTRAEGGTGTTTVALNTTDKNYSLTLGAGESKAVLPATITAITTDADNDIEHVKLKGKLSINGLQFNQKFPSLKTADLSGFDTSKVTNMYSMFNNCSALTTLDLSGFDTSKVTNMGYMFHNCAALTALDLSGFDTSKVTGMYFMFNNCSALTTLDLSGFDTGEVTNMYSMFNNCSALTTLDLSGFDTSKVTDMRYMFHRCRNLTTVTGAITGIKVSLSLSDSPLTNESAMVFINGLAEVTTAQTITFKATTYATLTEEQIAVATSKGWTVASV